MAFLSFLTLLFCVFKKIKGLTEGELSTMTCTKRDTYSNDYGTTHNLDLSTTNRFMSGLWSRHDNSYEDRKFAWRHCRPSNDLQSQIHNNIYTLESTYYEKEWERGCGGNTGLMYAYSWHNMEREDRRWIYLNVLN